MASLTNSQLSTHDRLSGTHRPPSASSRRWSSALPTSCEQSYAAGPPTARSTTAPACGTADQVAGTPGHRARPAGHRGSASSSWPPKPTSSRPSSPCWSVRPRRGCSRSPGVGPLSAAQVLVSWSHAGRFRLRGRLCRPGRHQPHPPSSGQVTRYRLNRGGDRQLNRALHTIVLVRLAPTPTPAPTWPGARPRARAGATPSGAADASSPASCSGCWNATTDPASKSSERLDST
jgi:hypothetical protein